MMAEDGATYTDQKNFCLYWKWKTSKTSKTKLIEKYFNPKNLQKEKWNGKLGIDCDSNDDLDFHSTASKLKKIYSI